MRLEFLGTDSRDGDCPTLYRTDRGTIVVQGHEVTDPEALADDETVVEVPEKLLRFAHKEGSP